MRSYMPPKQPCDEPHHKVTCKSWEKAQRNMSQSVNHINHLNVPTWNKNDFEFCHMILIKKQKHDLDK